MMFKGLNLAYDSRFFLDIWHKTPHCFCVVQNVYNLFTLFFCQMRFLDCREGRKDPSKSILDVGVEEAICFSGFDEVMFLKRGGKYVWSKADMKLEW